MNLRELKRKHHLSVDARLKMGLLTEDQAEQFKLFFSRCKKFEDFEQVVEALRGFCTKLQKDNDRYSRITRDDPLGIDE